MVIVKKKNDVKVLVQMDETLKKELILKSNELNYTLSGLIREILSQYMFENWEEND